MKVLSINFLTCAVKTCKSSSASFPLHPKDAELAQDEVEVNPQFLINVLPRLDWAALKTTSTEVTISLSHSSDSLEARDQPDLKLTSPRAEKLGFPELPAEPPSAEDLESNEAMLKELHSLLVETQMTEGKLVCGHCGHEYHVREGIANFLLPSHLV